LGPSLIFDTGTSKLSGLSWERMITLLKAVAIKFNIKGVYIVALAPVTSNTISVYTTTNVVYKIIRYPT
tara:strand:- start:4069 stop:4275 length:207 start_codon:yes stop_codon:yes gene_type:complete